jgi:pSer/pThr/pTyr-binding forkhead associated (FHA) protein
MASLIITSQGFDGRIMQLKMGRNRFGRSAKNDFQIEHATVSAHHCDINLGDAQVTVVDRDSTNGTYVDGKRVKEAILRAGQTLRLGDVDFLVESTDVSIAIPKFDRPMAAPPVVLSDGTLICPRHKDARATHQCTHCREVLCDTCVHRLRRKGGKVLLLCPLCSHACEPIGGDKKRKKSLLGFLQRTVKLPFLGESKKEGS